MCITKELGKIELHLALNMIEFATCRTNLIDCQSLVTLNR